MLNTSCICLFNWHLVFINVKFKGTRSIPVHVVHRDQPFKTRNVLAPVYRVYEWKSHSVSNFKLLSHDISLVTFFSGFGYCCNSRTWAQTLHCQLSRSRVPIPKNRSNCGDKNEGSVFHAKYRVYATSSFCFKNRDIANFTCYY